MNTKKETGTKATSTRTTTGKSNGKMVNSALHNGTNKQTSAPKKGSAK